jgi:hypothetical protein
MIRDLDVRLTQIEREYESKRGAIFRKGTTAPSYEELVDVLESIGPELAKPYRRKT